MMWHSLLLTRILRQQGLHLIWPTQQQCMPPARKWLLIGTPLKMPQTAYSPQKNLQWMKIKNIECLQKSRFATETVILAYYLDKDTIFSKEKHEGCSLEQQKQTQTKEIKSVGKKIVDTMQFDLVLCLGNYILSGMKYLSHEKPSCYCGTYYKNKYMYTFSKLGIFANYQKQIVLLRSLTTAEVI